MLAVDRPSTSEVQRWAAWRQVFADYLSLTKPRIIILLLVTTLCAMFAAARGVPDSALVTITLIGGALAAAAANTLNCVLDRDVDAVMRRTRMRRPIPAGRVAPHRALAFGLLLGTLSFLTFAVWVNLLSAVLATAGILFYVFIYTIWLKRTTPQNIVIGGAAGAVPPLVAWAAVTGRVELPAVLMFLVIFFWTPPHFWALAIKLKDDYASARIPMLPVVAGEAETHRQMFWYTVVTVVTSLALGWAGAMGPIYGAGAIVLGGMFLQKTWRLWRSGGGSDATWRLYRFSLVYLALLFAMMILDRILPSLT
ncbi:MAG: protoheme IX farnesyltransferase [Armatimonadetes bacterium]|nr:protoheme IX farnesyltransferase [Armatimonadota bacterium]